MVYFFWFVFKDGINMTWSVGVQSRGIHRLAKQGLCHIHLVSLEKCLTSKNFREKFGVGALFFCPKARCPTFDWNKGPEKNLSEDAIAEHFMKWACLGSFWMLPSSVRIIAIAASKKAFRYSCAYEILCHKFHFSGDDLQ